jgi:hypothetical protein
MGERRKFWEKLSRAYDRGEGSTDEIAARNGVLPGTFRHWRWRLRQLEASEARTAPQERRRQRRATRSPKLLRVELASAAGAVVGAMVEIQTVGGRALRVPVGTDPEYVGRLLRGLEQTC